MAISISGGSPSFEQRLVGNAPFGNAPGGGTQADNVGLLGRFGVWRHDALVCGDTLTAAMP